MRHTKQKLVAFDEATKNALTAEEKLQWQSEFNQLSVKLKTREAVLKDFCNQTGLKRDRYREQVFATKTENGLKNWGKSTSQKAVWGNKKAVDNVEKQIYNDVKDFRMVTSLDIQLFAEKDIKKQESQSLKCAIKKYKKNIALHSEKIENPKKYIESWDSLDQRQQEGLIKHWKKEIQNFQNSINDRITELKNRGDFDE